MSEQRTVKLPSGATLLLQSAPFAEAKALYQAMLKELKLVRLDEKAEVDVNFFKDLFCAGFASLEVEEALWKCIERCLYDKSKIIQETFEPLKNREDYFTVCFEVAKENVMPFTKSLYAQYNSILDLLKAKKGPA